MSLPGLCFPGHAITPPERKEPGGQYCLLCSRDTNEPTWIVNFGRNEGKGPAYLYLGKTHIPEWWTKRHITQAEFETFEVMEVFPVLTAKYRPLRYRLGCWWRRLKRSSGSGLFGLVIVLNILGFISLALPW